MSHKDYSSFGLMSCREGHPRVPSSLERLEASRGYQDEGKSTLVDLDGKSESMESYGRRHQVRINSIESARCNVYYTWRLVDFGFWGRRVSSWWIASSIGPWYPRIGCVALSWLMSIEHRWGIILGATQNQPNSTQILMYITSRINPIDMYTNENLILAASLVGRYQYFRFEFCYTYRYVCLYEPYLTSR